MSTLMTEIVRKISARDAHYDRASDEIADGLSHVFEAIIEYTEVNGNDVVWHSIQLKNELLAIVAEFSLDNGLRAISTIGIPLTMINSTKDDIVKFLCSTGTQFDDGDNQEKCVDDCVLEEVDTSPQIIHRVLH